MARVAKETMTMKSEEIEMEVRVIGDVTRTDTGGREILLEVIGQEAEATMTTDEDLGMGTGTTDRGVRALIADLSVTCLEEVRHGDKQERTCAIIDTSAQSYFSGTQSNMLYISASSRQCSLC